ncbi:MAG: rhodanese-like domain-containing protein [Prolixibacteraceae bacterium]|nr:rhodanese-like domain-containing protein [Prolixibacteraceae bacterium]
MNARQKISIILVATSLMLLFLPGIGEYSFQEKPGKMVQWINDDDSFVTVDEVAVLLNKDEPVFQLIDLRSEEAFKLFNIPGSINIPFQQFFEKQPETWLYNHEIQYIFYGNGDVNSNYALVLARGLGYENCFVMKGGLNEWFNTVMNSKFSGERITPRENALFENRLKARQYFTAINSLPDSLKIKFAESKRQAARSLDGGCN